MKKTLLFACYAAIAGAPAVADQLLAIQGAEVLTMAGKRIASGTILISDGRIVAVGPAAKVKIPWRARVIPGKGKVAVPGMILAHTAAGDENVPLAHFITVHDSINPVGRLYKNALRNGITTIHVTPGNRNLFGGRGVVVRPWGPTVEAMTLVKDSCVKMSFEPRTNRMALMALLRKTVHDVKKYIEEFAAKHKIEKGKPVGHHEKIDAQRGYLVRLVEGTLPAFIYCSQAADVLRALQFLQENKLVKAVFVLDGNTDKAAAILARHKYPVIVESLERVETDLEGNERRIHPARIFSDRKVRLSLIPENAFPQFHPWITVTRGRKFGLTTEQAIRAVTIEPAGLLGLDKRLGTLEPGKDGNVVLMSGDPLRITTWVDIVVLEGKVVYERSKDEELTRLLAAPEAARKATKKKTTKTTKND